MKFPKFMNQLVFFFLVVCPLRGVARSLDTFKFSGASVLPIFSLYNPQENRYIDYVILTHERGGKNKCTFDDFGGKKEANHPIPLITASNEFWEEALLQDTLGWSELKTRNYLDPKNINLDPKNINTETIIALSGPGVDYVTFITRFDGGLITNWYSNFHPALKKQKEWRFKEKDRVALVRWSEIVDAIKKSQGNTAVKVSARLINPRTNRRERDRTFIDLRPKLVRVLRPLIENWQYEPGDLHQVRFYNEQKRAKIPDNKNLLYQLHDLDISLTSLNYLLKE